jgi:hypothetical protein
MFEKSRLVAPDFPAWFDVAGEIVLVYAAERAPRIGDILARNGRHVLVVVGPRDRTRRPCAAASASVWPGFVDAAA